MILHLTSLCQISIATQLMNLKLLEEYLLDFEKVGDAKNQGQKVILDHRQKARKFHLKPFRPIRSGTTKSQVMVKINQLQRFKFTLF